MERYFIIDKYNTFTDWDLILTSKTITPPEPKTYYVEIDGMNGSIDLSESLSGTTVYKDRTISATFWTDKGNRSDRVKLLRQIRSAIHGKKVSIIEPDDPNHHFLGRIKITNEINNLAYAEISIEATCEPYRYSNDKITRSCVITASTTTDIVINNSGVKTISPVVKIEGNITITYNDSSIELTTGSYKILELTLYQGVNVVRVAGEGVITFEYEEADI